MIKILLAVIALVFALPNSGAAQQSIQWVDMAVLHKCAVQGFDTHSQQLKTVYGETELFLGKTTVPLFDITTNRFEPIEGALVVYANQTTGTFSLLVLFKDGSFCEMSPGFEFTPY